MTADADRVRRAGSGCSASATARLTTATRPASSGARSPARYVGTPRAKRHAGSLIVDFTVRSVSISATTAAKA